jgi:two-component system sensor histidine kinase PilS (NtrC family)
MFKSKNNPLSNDHEITRKINILILGRLALILVILVVGWFWALNYPERSIQSFVAGGSLLFFLALGLTVIYFLALHLFNQYLWLVRIQFLLDILLITLIVKETGDIISPFTTLYLVLIGVTGIFCNKIETLFIALLSTACFSILSIFSSESLIYSFSGEVAPSRLIQILAFNSIGILIVGLLAGYLSDRRNFSRQLQETEASFADLNALHKSILESIRSGLITTDLSGKIYTFNQAAEDISGQGSGQIIGQNIFSVFKEKAHPIIKNCLNDATEGKTFPTKHFETEITRPEEDISATRKISVACSILPLFGKAEKIQGLILTLQDITEIRLMEENLRQSDRLAAVGRMSAGLAHEIRNPLGSMSSALQFLQERITPETPEEDLMEVVLRESDRLDKIITNFLTYANPSADIFAKEDLELMDINQALRDCLILLKHSPELKESHLLNFETTDVPVNIRANETQIKQVFWNVLRNSIQAMPGGGNLSIKLREFPGRNVRIIFADTGCGISQENLRHLFEPFSSSSGGIGLGLSIVHQIVLNHDGHIDVQSRENQGTTITLELPQEESIKN